jgi:hypothetical protein
VTDPRGQYTEKLFEWQKIASALPIAREFLESMPPGIQDPAFSFSPMGFALDQVVLHLRAFVLTHDLGEHSVTRTKTVDWPATPWQHWKQRHAEAWWLRWFVARRPVRMQTEVVDFHEAWQELAAYPWQTRLPRMPEGFGAPSRMVRILTHEWTNPDD